MTNKHHNNFWTSLLTSLIDRRSNSTDANNIVTDYTYDAGNRITNWNRAGAPVNNAQSWNYDDNGNWISTTKDGTTEARNHDNTDQLTQIAGKASTNDAKGNLAAYEQNGKEYEIDYDLDNRIIKVDVDNNDVEKYRRLVGILDLESEANVARRVSSREADANQYRYDALGRRVIRQEGTTKTALIWWGNSEKHRRLVGVLARMSGASEARRVKAREASLNQCAEHKHQAGQTVIQNDIMAHPSRLNSVIARAVDGSKFKLEWYHKNYLDHVYAVSDDSGDILEHYRYTAFGEVQIYNALGNQVATTQIDNHILWNTRRRDEVTGFYLYKFRHYSPELGRWLARDPIEEKGGINLYAFVGNKPYNYWDILGLACRQATDVGNKSFIWIETTLGSYRADGMPDKNSVENATELFRSISHLSDLMDAGDIVKEGVINGANGVAEAIGVSLGDAGALADIATDMAIDTLQIAFDRNANLFLHGGMLTVKFRCNTCICKKGGGFDHNWEESEIMYESYIVDIRKHDEESLVPHSNQQTVMFRATVLEITQEDYNRALLAAKKHVKNRF